MLRGPLGLLAPFILAAVSACAAGAVFPTDVQQAFREQDMVRAETEHLVLYYPAKRQAQAERFAARANACAAVLKSRAQHHGRAWAEKMTITMPEVAYNNAYVSPKIAGSPDISVIPTYNSLDFTTEFGLPPDPGFIACHELVHYVQGQQISGLWAGLNLVMGDLYTPQLGFDSWFWEGLATHYESALQPGAGRPSWPLFNGLYAAAYAGQHVSGGELSQYGRKSPVGHNYLVGTMFVRFLMERYGEAAAWKAIAEQAGAWTGLLSPRSFNAGFGKYLGALLDEFNTWSSQQFPVRARPAAQQRRAALGKDARYTRSREGSEAWIASELDRPAHLVVRDRDGRVRADVGLVGLLPGRALTFAVPLTISGLSMTADGQEVWFTAVDSGETSQTTRLLRWRPGDGLRQVAQDLGPGGTVDATGAHYYFLRPDGDRWSLAVYDVAARTHRTLLEASPGTYVLTAQLSPDGRTVAASAWNGAAFTLWLLDAATGALRRELTAQGPLYDPAFLDDGRLVHLAAVDGRFQVQLRSAEGDAPVTVTDVPYTALAPRGSGAQLRFLNREGWQWTLDEVAVPAAPALAPVPPAAPAPTEPGAPAPLAQPAQPALTAAAPGATPALTPPLAAAAAAPPPTLVPPTSVRSPLGAPRPYSAWEDFFFPSLRSPSVETVTSGPTVLGLKLGGSDVLGMHSWLLAGYAQPEPKGSTGGPYLGGLARYRNTMLAPWTFLAEGRALHASEELTPDDPAADPVLRDRWSQDLVVLVSRSWFETVEVAGAVTYSKVRANSALPLEPAEDLRLGGPSLSLSYFAGDASEYTGLRRALFGSLIASYFPRQWGSLDRSATSLRAELFLKHNLPLTRRHTVALSTVGRAIVREADLIELGGAGAFAPVSFDSNKPDPVDPTVDVPPNLRLQEPVRGYEDTLFAVSRLAAAELSWTYPIIFDRGLASTAWILPASYLRQLDLNLFAAGALSTSVATGSAEHLALGGGVTLRLSLLNFPFSLRYQLARRLRDDRATTSMLAVGALL